METRSRISTLPLAREAKAYNHPPVARVIEAAEAVGEACHSVVLLLARQYMKTSNPIARRRLRKDLYFLTLFRHYRALARQCTAKTQLLIDLLRLENQTSLRVYRILTTEKLFRKWVVEAAHAHDLELLLNDEPGLYAYKVQKGLFWLFLDDENLSHSEVVRADEYLSSSDFADRKVLFPAIVIGFFELRPGELKVLIRQGQLSEIATSRFNAFVSDLEADFNNAAPAGRRVNGSQAQEPHGNCRVEYLEVARKAKEAGWNIKTQHGKKAIWDYFFALHKKSLALAGIINPEISQGEQRDMRLNLFKAMKRHMT